MLTLVGNTLIFFLFPHCILKKGWQNVLKLTMETMQTYFTGSRLTHKVNSVIIQPSIQPPTTNSSSPSEDILAVSDENNIQPKKKKNNVA